MPIIHPVRRDIVTYLKKRNLLKEWLKAKLLFESNPRHPSLQTELLEPKENLIYSLRLDKKYRAIFLVHPDKSVEIIAVTNHYKK